MQKINIDYKLSRKTEKPMAVEWAILKVIQNKEVFYGIDFLEILEEKFMIKNSRNIVESILENLIEEKYIINNGWYPRGEEIEGGVVIESTEGTRIIDEKEILGELDISEKGLKYMVEGIVKELDEEEQILSYIFYIDNIKENIFLSKNGEMILEMKNKQKLKENICILGLENQEVVIIIKGNENIRTEDLQIVINKITNIKCINTVCEGLKKNQEKCKRCKEILSKVEEIQI